MNDNIQLEKNFNFINDIEHGKMVIQADGYYLNNLLK